jgi:hypothetical protein
MRLFGLDFGKEEGRWLELAKGGVVVAFIVAILVICLSLSAGGNGEFDASALVKGVQLVSAHMLRRLRLDYTNNLFAPILAGLIVAGVTGALTWTWAQLKARRRMKEKLRSILEAAPRQYVEELDKLIQRGIAEGPEKAVVNARAIVGARNSLRSSLVSISKQLNSQIDRLALEIGEDVELPVPPSTPRANEKARDDPGAAFQTIEVLSRTWPSKKVEIENEIRKILTELRLDPDSLDAKFT